MQHAAGETGVQLYPHYCASVKLQHHMMTEVLGLDLHFEEGKRRVSSKLAPPFPADSSRKCYLLNSFSLVQWFPACVPGTPGQGGGMELLPRGLHIHPTWADFGFPPTVPSPGASCLPNFVWGQLLAGLHALACSLQCSHLSPTGSPYYKPPCRQKETFG